MCLMLIILLVAAVDTASPFNDYAPPLTTSMAVEAPPKSHYMQHHGHQ